MFPSRLEQNQLKASIAASYNKLYSQFSANELQEVGNYKLLKVVGEGSYGKVYLASHRLTHQKVVLKMGSKSDPNVVREVFYHRQFDYIYITKLYEVIVTENYVWMALEYCPGRELYEYLLFKKHIPLVECAKLFSQILGGVYYAHSMKCVHRDLKLENILLDKKGQAKLTDFGFTRECATKGTLETVCGTTVYMAPELIERKPYEGYKTDIWSLGIILYTLIHGTMPFDEDDEMKTKLKIVNENPGYNRDLIDADGEDLVSKLLQKDPQQRPSLPQVLQHPFLQPYGISILEKTEKVMKRQRHGSKNFHSKLERKLLKRLKQTGFDTQAIKHSVNKKKCDTLSGFWYLLLEKEKRSEILRHPRRSRSVLSVKKVFDSSAPSRKSTDNPKKDDNVGKTTTLRRIMSLKSDTASIRPPPNLANSKETKKADPLDGVSSQTSSGRSIKRPNFFHKMTSFFKSKKQAENAANEEPVSPRSDSLDKRKRNAISFESRKNSPKRSPTRSGNKDVSEKSGLKCQKPTMIASNGNTNLKAEEPRLKKFKSNTSSEMSRQTSLGNYDSELENKPAAISDQSMYDESRNDNSKVGPISILSQQSEISNDTYNSEYSTDGNASNSKPNSSMSSHNNRNTSSVVLSPNMDSIDNSSLQSRVNGRGSMSIISSASSASEKSSRTDSFYEISTASSPKTMDLRAMSTYANADTTVPRAAVGSQWLAKRGRSPVGRRGRLPKRNISRKLLNKSSTAAQSVIQEESSFDDDEDNAGIPVVHATASDLERPSGMKENTALDAPALPVFSVLSQDNPLMDRRPALFDMTRSLSGSSGRWSHNFLEDRNSEGALQPGEIHDEHSILGIADDEDNS
ncbi:LAME_0F12574g1_1 [Lachancea meyersii CBS 8951]|uniref:non-specific serine/threonine protein kinase n=1 Tax=Lachancea meyersii CBS 8951 TaxID=1266667 RepID=A0A1G4JWY1_9SACH|nr:LAME_0F12574g1_1 [Lachancea meyersii CBS 8951]